MSAGVSILIPTRNERRNIDACLASVAFSDDIVVVDSLSTDGTAEVARERGARVVPFRWDGGHPKKKNWALEHVQWKHPWVFILDADERIPAELATEIKAAVVRENLVGYFVNRRFLFMGRFIRHCGYYPSWNLRLFQHALGRYERLVDGDTGSGDNEIHEHLVVDGSTGFLKHDMLHEAYPDIATWVEKHNRYSSWEAAVEIRGIAGDGAEPHGPNSRRRHLRRLARRLPFRPTLRFLYSYVLRGGFLDGYPGYVLCRLLATYELLSALKARELESRRLL